MEPRNPITKEQIQCALRERHSAGVQDKLDHARVAVAGLGGLGSNVAFALARIGVGHLHLIDFDRVDLANLNRQQYFLRHLGMYKTDALKEELLQINPLSGHPDRLCPCDGRQSSGALCRGPDRLRSLCSPEAKAMLVNGILEHFPAGLPGLRLRNGWIQRQQPHPDAQNHRSFYLCGDGIAQTGPGYGLMAPRVALCAAHEANCIAQYICTTKGEEP